MAAFISQNHGLVDGNSPDSPAHVISPTANSHTNTIKNAISGMATPLDDSVSDESMDDDAPLFTSGRQVFQTKQQNHASSKYDSRTDQNGYIPVNTEKSFGSRTTHRSIIFSDDDDDVDGDIENTVTQLHVQRRNNRAVLSESDEDDI
jgi:hypothetical protein